MLLFEDFCVILHSQILFKYNGLTQPSEEDGKIQIES